MVDLALCLHHDLSHREVQQDAAGVWGVPGSVIYPPRSKIRLRRSGGSKGVDKKVRCSGAMHWIPAYAGMTITEVQSASGGCQGVDK